MDKKIKVLIIDASLSACSIFENELAKDSELEIVASVQNINSVHQILRNVKPDVFVLDIELPKLDSMDFLIMMMNHFPTPTIITCPPTQKGRLNALQAIQTGAIEIVAKPPVDQIERLNEIIPSLINKIKIAGSINLKNLLSIFKPGLFTGKIIINKEITNLVKAIIIGASSGGIEPFRRLVEKLPVEFPCIISVLDLPPGFTKPFAYKLNETSELEVKEATEGEIISHGKVIIAPSDFHLRICFKDNIHYVETPLSQKIYGRRPSLDILMLSSAENLGKSAVGVLLSSSGDDGVIGLKSMMLSGASTIAQSPDTCVVSETIEKAIAFDSVKQIIPVNNIPSALISLL